MLSSLIRGFGMGAGMGVGQEVARDVIRGMKNKRSGGSNTATFGNTAISTAPPTQRDIQCGGCGEFNTSESKFCGACGTCLMTKYSIENGVTCSCGFTNAKGQKFCSECGKSIT
jgi:hypothetical protein